MGSPVLEYEAGQTPYPMEALTNEGDNQTFEGSFQPWSDEGSVEPIVLPYGVLTGGVVTPDTGTDDSVNVAPATLSMAGSLAANADGVVSPNVTSPVSVTRGSGTDTHRMTSITVDDAGTLQAIAGAPGESFTEDRGENGGPPWIPLGSVEIAQVRLTSVTEADVLPSEIFQVPNVHQERADQPTFEIHYATGAVLFAYPLPTIHSGGETKRVYAKAAMPIFVPVMRVSDYSPAENTYNMTSTDTYDGPVAPKTPGRSVGAMSFNAILRNGLSDPFIQQKGKRLWFKFRPDRDRSAPYQLTQGVLGIDRTFPAGGGNITASCTVTPAEESTDVVD